MSAPTFSLASCPLCSTLLSQERPFWRYAHNTSRARQRPCYFFSGCAHAGAVFPACKVVEESNEIAAIENAWGLRCEELFAQKTTRWTDVQRANFRRALDGKHSLLGATEPLDFGEQEPAKLGPLAEAVRRELESPF